MTKKEAVKILIKLAKEYIRDTPPAIQRLLFEKEIEALMCLGEFEENKK